MSSLSHGEAGIEVQESLGSDLVGSDCQAKEPRLDSEGLGSCQCGVVRDALWEMSLAAESGPQEGLEVEPCMPGHWTLGENLGGAHSLVELRHIHRSIMSHVISGITKLGRRPGAVFLLNNKNSHC